MGNIDDLYAAINRVEQAEDTLSELTAVYDMSVLVDKIKRMCVLTALQHHTAGEVGRALGVSRQAIDQKYRVKPKGSNRDR